MLTGVIPSEIGNARSLSILNMIDLPRLTGTIPSSIGKLTQMEIMNIVNMNMSGPINPFISNMTYLDTLVLEKNHITGRVPADLCKLSNLKVIDVGYNPGLECFDVCLWNRYEIFIGDINLTHCPGRKLLIILILF